MGKDEDPYSYTSLPPVISFAMFTLYLCTRIPIVNVAVQFAFALHFSYSCSGFHIEPHHCLGIHINANFMLALVAGKGKMLLFPAFTSLPTMQFGQNYLSLPWTWLPFLCQRSQKHPCCTLNAYLLSSMTNPVTSGRQSRKNCLLNISPAP